MIANAPTAVNVHLEREVEFSFEGAHDAAMVRQNMLRHADPGEALLEAIIE